MVKKTDTRAFLLPNKLVQLLLIWFIYQGYRLLNIRAGKKELLHLRHDATVTPRFLHFHIGQQYIVDFWIPTGGQRKPLLTITALLFHSHLGQKRRK